ncbi:hypothetical protein MRX96_017083, partial [Rhipicephalus microplus]
ESASAQWKRTTGKCALFYGATPVGSLEYPDDLDIGEALQRRGLSDLFTSITQVPHSHAWVVKLRPFATAAKEDLVNDGAITVKGVRCTVFETNPRKTKVVVHRVPFHVSDMFVWSELQKYGVVTNVVCHKTDKDDSDYVNTIRDAYVYLKKGLSLSDLPDVEESQEVPVEPGDSQVAPAAEGDGEERNVSHQELAPVAEEAAANEPHEVTPHQETGNASSGDLNDSSEDGEAPPSN